MFRITRTLCILPSISKALEPTGTGMLWIIDAYPLVLAGLLVSMGGLGDRIGRRRLLLIGSVGFVAVSVGAAFAPSTEWLIAARAALGFFGAMLMPSTLSLLRSVFVDRDQRRHGQPELTVNAGDDIERRLLRRTAGAVRASDEARLKLNQPRDVLK